MAQSATPTGITQRMELITLGAYAENLGCKLIKPIPVAVESIERGFIARPTTIGLLVHGVGETEKGALNSLCVSIVDELEYLSSAREVQLHPYAKTLLAQLREYVG